MNVLFILVDDLGWRDLACYGSTFYETPHLDALAAEGGLFTAAYAACPVCSPSRAAILTGKYPARLHLTDWLPGDKKQKKKVHAPEDLDNLPLEEFTLAEAFSEKGYKTFFAGKWHLGKKGHFPEDQGFEINKGGHDKGSPPGGYYAPFKNPKLKDSSTKSEYLPDRLTDETIEFIQAHKEKPFLAFLSFYTVHTPITACRRHLDRFTKKAAGLPPLESSFKGNLRIRQDSPEYASMVYAMDENVGRLLKALDELQLRDSTIVVFTSDNGGLATLQLRKKISPTSCLPLRGGKGWCYEGGVRVPLIVRAPGVRPGSVHADPVTGTDLYPTLLELAGLEPLEEQHVDGESLVPLFNGEDSLGREAIFWHYPHYHVSGWKPGAAVRSGDWKLVEKFEDSSFELYNLKDDPGENTNLAARNPEKAQALLKALHQWQRDVNAQMPTRP